MTYCHPFTNSFVVVYLDDILIFNKSWEEHLQHIQQVLHTLQQHKLYANLEKLSFGMNRVQYLRYIVDEHGVHVDPTKIQVICDCPAPDNTNQDLEASWALPTSIADSCWGSLILHGPSTR
jgi:hypothetical protein